VAVEAIALAPVLNKLIGLGISAWKAHEKHGEYTVPEEGEGDNDIPF
jgi:hypothetical protein